MGIRERKAAARSDLLHDVSFGLSDSEPGEPEHENRHDEAVQESDYPFVRIGGPFEEKSSVDTYDPDNFDLDVDAATDNGTSTWNRPKARWVMAANKIREQIQEPTGLHKFYSGSDVDKRHVCDIVFVHGLNGGAISTWKSKSENVLWPKDLLPKDFPAARIYSFGYKVNAWADSQPPVFDAIAQDLLSSLAAARSDEATRNRPIVFIAHSLGGLLVKACLVLSRSKQKIVPEQGNIDQSTVGIVFLGTPHHARTRLGWINVLSKIASISNSQEELPQQSVASNSLNSFRTLLDTFDSSLDQSKVSISSFYESQAMTTGGMPSLITERSNALYHPSERVESLEGDHVSICQFQNEYETGYLKIELAVRESLENHQEHRLVRRSTNTLLEFAGVEDPPTKKLKSRQDDGSNAATSVVDDDQEMSYSKKLKTVRTLLNASVIGWEHIPLPSGGTCSWLLESEELREWLRLSSRVQHDTASAGPSTRDVLIINGVPGSGKSVVARYIIEHLVPQARLIDSVHHPRPYILNFFYNLQADSQHTGRDILHQLIMQLLEINPSLVRHFPDEDLNMDFRSTPQPALWLLDTMPNTHMSVNMQNHSAPQSPFGVDALSGILLSMLRDSEVADTFIVIDGLDEFDQGALQLVYRLLGDLINIANKRVCLTFRSRDDISDELHRVVNRERCCYLQIDTGHGFNADIRSCTQRLLDSLTKQRNLPSELLDEIKRLVSSSGRFADAYLWRMLLFQVLERLPTLKIIRTFLKKLQTESSPSQTKLEALYSASFDCLVEKSDQTSMAILCFSALARRSLTLEELSCLLVAYKQNLVEEQRKQSTDVSLDTEAHFDLDGLDNGKLLHIEDWICSELFGFLVIKAGVVSLIHSSARRAIIAYLKQRGTCQQREKDFTAACLLLMALLRRSGKVITYDGKTHTPSVDFLGYAIGNWHVHLKNAGSEAKNIHYLVEEVWCNEQLRPLLLEFTNRKHPRVSQLTLPCVLAALDLSENLRLSVTPHARARDSPLQLPMELRFAVANNSVEAFEVLKGIYRLEMGFLDENGQNLMDYAVWAGSVELADMLAKYGIKATKSSDAYVKAVEKHPDFEKVYNLKVFSNPGTSIFRSEVFLSAVSQGNDAIIQLAIQYNSFDAAVIQRALEKAVDTQQFSTVEILLGHRKQRNLTSEVNLATCLCKAANRANLPITQKLLDDGANSNEHDIHGVSPLHFGAQSGRLEIVELLVEARARKSAIDNKGQKPIHWAARRGHSSIVEYLISPPNDIDMFGRSALSLACKNGSFPTISILLEYGAGVNKKDRSGRTALHEAATSGSREMVKLLLEKGANPYLASKREMTPLHEAARKGWFSVAQELLAFTGSDLVNLPDIDKKTPLHYACLSRNPSARLVQLLLDLGAKPNAVDKEEKTALHMAAKYGNVATVELLIKKYATIHLKDMYGMTPLHYAAKKGRTDVVVSLLTRASTDLDSGAQSGEGSASNPISMYQDNFGRTPLHYAVETHSYKLVGRLLEAYKGPHLAEFLAAKDNQGMRALDLVDSGRTSPSGVVKLLKEAESNLTAVSEAAPEQISLEKSE